MSSSVRTVFLVDDEPAIAEAVGFALQSEGLQCRHFATGGACLEALGSERPCLLLLDIGLPDGSGLDFFRRIREQSDVPIVFLTSRKEEIDRVVGLEMGADDYVVKPFSVRELMARVRMVIRRSETDPLGAVVAESAAARAQALAAQTPPMPPQFSHDTSRRQIHFHGKPLDLTLHEYRLLEVLLKHPGRVYARAELLELAWEAPDHRLDRTVDSHIKSLRAKLRDISAATDPIQTHRGMGYSLDPEA